MKRSPALSSVKGLFLLLVVAACRAPATAQPMSPAMHAAPDAAMSPPPAAGQDSARHGYSAADVRFMKHMIDHHGQALTMTALVAERSRSEPIRLLAERISVSQKDEIAMMRRWLEARHEAMPADGDAHHDHHPSPSPSLDDNAVMPGMLRTEEMARLAGASGAGFDSLFLGYMIRHHEGALSMVAALFSTNGAGQEPELFRLASDVDADQRAEIARMRTLQASAATSLHHP